MDTANRTSRGAQRFDPMSVTWPIIALDVAWVTLLTLGSWLAVSAVVEGTLAQAFAFVAVAGIVLLVCTALPLRHFLLRQRDEAREREALLGAESGRREFESRLVRALDMAADQHAAVAVAVEAVTLLSPTACGELLLADSSRAHMQPVGTTPPTDCGSACHCDVATPSGCPAVRSGHAIHHEDTRLLDACPNLRHRGVDALSALCVPVSVAGSSVGVLHLVRGANEPFDAREIAGATTIAKMTGSRIGMLSAMAQSQLQASTDPLTGLLNRRSLENEVRTLLQQGDPIAVILADLDHFKVLNDTHGHDAGDRALRTFARVLLHAVRDADLVCRYGGEEFIVVCPGSDKFTAALAFDRVRLELEATLGDGRTPPFTVSAGIADSTDADDFTDMITLADIALLQAKSDGRNRSQLALQT